MAKATTTLSSAVTVDADKIVVASATSMAAGRLIRIDDEWMQVAQHYTTGTTVPVLRGREGSAQVSHVVTANVTHGLASDFPTPAPQTSVTVAYQRAVELRSITATGSLDLPKPGTDLRVVLNGTSVVALTIPVPTKDLDGCRLTIVGNGVAAHTLTFTGGLSGAGSGYDVITVNATAPAAFDFIACNGLWLAICGPAMGGTVTNIIGSVA